MFIRLFIEVHSKKRFFLKSKCPAAVCSILFNWIKLILIIILSQDSLSILSIKHIYVIKVIVIWGAGYGYPVNNTISQSVSSWSTKYQVWSTRSFWSGNRKPSIQFNSFLMIWIFLIAKWTWKVFKKALKISLFNVTIEFSCVNITEFQLPNFVISCCELVNSVSQTELLLSEL